MITFWRACGRGWWRAGGALAVVLLLTGCAAGGRQPAAGSAMQTPATGGARYATITAVRPVPPPAAASGGAILADLGVGRSVAALPLAELVLRTDDGAVLSVVQPQAAEWAPGNRVQVLPGDRLTLVRPGYTAPTS